MPDVVLLNYKEKEIMKYAGLCLVKVLITLDSV